MERMRASRTTCRSIRSRQLGRIERGQPVQSASRAALGLGLEPDQMRHPGRHALDCDGARSSWRASKDRLRARRLSTWSAIDPACPTRAPLEVGAPTRAAGIMGVGAGWGEEGSPAGAGGELVVVAGLEGVVVAAVPVEVVEHGLFGLGPVVRGGRSLGGAGRSPRRCRRGRSSPGRCVGRRRGPGTVRAPVTSWPASWSARVKAAGSGTGWCPMWATVVTRSRSVADRGGEGVAQVEHGLDLGDRDRAGADDLTGLTGHDVAAGEGGVVDADDHLGRHPPAHDADRVGGIETHVEGARAVAAPAGRPAVRPVRLAGE